MAAWWKKHDITGNYYHLRHYTIPKTFAFVEPFLSIIEENYRERRRVEQAKRRAKRRAEKIALGDRQQPTAVRIVNFAESAGVVHAEQVGTALDLSVAAARRQLARLTETGALVRVGRGRYAVAGDRHE